MARRYLPAVFENGLYRGGGRFSAGLIFCFPVSVDTREYCKEIGVAAALASVATMFLGAAFDGDKKDS